MRQIERETFERLYTLNADTNNVIGKTFPMGRGWYAMLLQFIYTTTGTATTSEVEGELKAIKNIRIRTSNGETICDLPGRALYRIAQLKNGTAPVKDAIANAAGTYKVNIPIYFVDESMINPMDTILDTARYNAVTVECDMGGTNELYTTIGSALLSSIQLNVEVVQSATALPLNVQPQAYISYIKMQPSDPNTQTYVDIERADDLNIKRVYTHSASSATAGLAFSGDNDDAILDIVSIKDNIGYLMKERVHSMVSADNKLRYGLEAENAGFECHDFVEDGSIVSSIYTGDKSKLRYEWTNGTVAANDQVSLAVECIRALN